MLMHAEILPVFLGPFIGSFLLTIAHRYPGLEGLAFGRSACPACHTTIGVRDLVPVLSWLMLGGRCRHCAAWIGWQYPMAEIAAAAIAIWAVTTVSGWLLWVSCALGWSLLALSFIDFHNYRLPDFLTVPILLAGLAVTWWAWPSALPDHLLGIIFGYSTLAGLGWLYRLLRRREGIGFGDAKLLAAGGAWLSWQTLPSVLLSAALLGLTAVLIGRLTGRISLKGTTPVPFGPCLAVAIWVSWLYGPLDFVT
jgi:leader peptidase (prepilin peptidase) / N-methyltransferase